MLRTILVPGQPFLDSLKTYVGFTDESSATLAASHALVAPHFGTIIDDFYRTIEAHPGARAAITGGHEQIERLKRTLLQWIDEVFRGPHDLTYLERRARIGRVHVRINLPQAYMFTAVDRIRVKTLDVLRATLAADTDRLRRVSTALHQLLDIELAIMLETYKEDLEAKNRTAERLSTIGQFAAGIGHELRNPLGVMESSVFLLRQRLGQLSVDDAGLTKHLDKIAVEVQRSNKTINDLLELARNRAPRRVLLPAKALISRALNSVTVPPAVAIDVAAAEEVLVDGDPDQLGHILANLILNASQAMNGSGRIWIEARRLGSEVELRVRDDGPGVPAEIRHRIFEALFTTKAKGSGLGLALCRRIAESHGGDVVLEPSPGGAAFLVTLPTQHGPAS